MASVPVTTAAPAPTGHSHVGGAIALIDDNRQAALRALSAEISSQEVSTLDETDPHDAVRRIQIECSENIKLWDKTPCEIRVRHILIRTAEQMDRATGELESKLRTHLITPTGEVFATNSPVAARVGMALLAMPGAVGGFDPPIRVQASKVATASGGSCLVLTAAIADLQKLADKLTK
jgi:hypothetical protein